MNTLFKQTRFKNSLSLTLLASVLSTLLTGCGLLSEHSSAVSVQLINSELAENMNQFDQTDEMIDKFSDKVGYPLEGLCFYQPQGKMSPQQVFLLDESSMAHQMLIQQHEGDFSLQEIRQFPLPPNAEYCVVDDASDQLFVSEEHVGVWVYSARAESEVSRAIIDLVKPYGNLNQNSGPLAMVNQQLFVAEKESHYIHQYSVDKYKTSQDKVILHGSYQLGTEVKLDGLNVKQEGAHFILNYLDDSTEKAFKAEVLVGNNIMNNSPASERYIITIPADAETQPVSDAGDAADDPAIWLHPTVAEKSLVFGTNKQRGLLVYGLDGALVQQLNVGRVNNVDIRQGFTYKGSAADIAAASQRDNHSIALFHISPLDGEVLAVNEIITGLDDVYGLCMYRGLERKVYVFINDEDGRYEQYEISDSATGWSGT
jgi:3-phytase